MFKLAHLFSTFDSEVDSFQNEFQTVAIADGIFAEFYSPVRGPVVLHNIWSHLPSSLLKILEKKCGGECEGYR